MVYLYILKLVDHPMQFFILIDDAAPPITLLDILMVVDSSRLVKISFKRA